MPQLLPELSNLMQVHDLDDVKITVTPDGYIRVFTLNDDPAYPLAIPGYDVWFYEGSEFLAKA